MKQMIIYLTLANLIDGILTFIGLEQSLIEEGNPLMSYLYSIDPFLFIGLKMILSVVLFCFIFYKKVLESKLINRLALFAVVAYSYILLLHGNWIGNVIFS